MSEGHAPGSPEPPTEKSPRWGQIWACHTLLLRVARRYGADTHEAEDIAQEAMLRAAEHPEIGDDRLQAWLVTVTRRLCMDGHRRRSSEIRRWERASRQAVVQQPPGQRPEEQVCDRSEAVWVASRATELLPPRQAEALHLIAAGCDVQQVASKLGVNYCAAESLLARARRTLRAALTAGAGAVAWIWRGPATTASNSASMALASVAAVGGVAIVVIPIVLFPHEISSTFWAPSESHGRSPTSSIHLDSGPLPRPSGVDNPTQQPPSGPHQVVLPLTTPELAISTPQLPLNSGSLTPPLRPGQASDLTPPSLPLSAVPHPPAALLPSEVPPPPAASSAPGPKIK